MNRRKVFKITKDQIANVCGLPFGLLVDQNPKRSACKEIVPNSTISGSMVGLGDMYRNQLALYSCVCENMIPNERGLNKRQAEHFYVLQKRIEIQEDDTYFHEAKFQFSIPIMFMESISHCKDHPRDDFPVFITKVIRSLVECITEESQLRLRRSLCSDV